MKRLITLFAAGILWVNSANALTITESTDLSNSTSTPTYLGQLSVGSNTISGHVNYNSQDYYDTFSIGL